MYACLQIPFFPLSVLLRDDPESARAPAALLSAAPDPSASSPTTSSPLSRHRTAKANVLLAVNRAAARHQLTPGLNATRALARCPNLALLTPDPTLERQHQSELRDFASSLAPDFEETAPGTFLLDLLTLPHALATPLDWIESTLRRATPLRLPLRLALAPTPDLALLAVHSSSLTSTLSFTPDPAFRIRHAESNATTLADLPLATLSPHGSPAPCHADLLPPQQADLLQLWGIETLGDLAVLPRQGLAERLGDAAARLHDILHAKHHRLLTLHRPPQHYQVSRELEEALETLDPLLFLLRRGLDTLCARLAAAQRAAIAARLTLTFDDGNLHVRDLRLPEPSVTPATLLRLLHTHLDTVRAPAPVVAWSLQLTPTLPGEAQHHLFEHSLRDPNKFADTLARLEALLGPGRLGTPHPLPTHKPDSFLMNHRDPRPGAPGGPRQPPAPRPAPGDPATPHHHDALPLTTTALPLKRYRPAPAIHVASEPRGRYHHPLALLTGPHRGRVTAAHGPFPLSGNWWDPGERWQQVEWDLQLSNGTLLRLAFDPSRDPARQWRLEGIYE